MLDWNKRDGKIGEVELAPRVTFIVYASPQYIQGTWKQCGTKYTMGYEIDGNTGGARIDLDTKAEVEAYLENQKNLLPKYLTLLAKRKAIAKRIDPLQAKWFKYADDISNLAKS